MNYSYGTNADKYLNEEGLQYLITKIKEMSGGTIDLTNYYNKTEVDDLLANIDGGTGISGVGIQSVVLTDYELIITLTDATVINLGNVRGATGLNGTNGTNGIDGEQGIQGLTGSDGADGTNGADGRGISTIVKTGTVLLVDTYTITYTDATTSTFTITNGASGDGGGGSSLQVYATTETAIGTWIDATTIYRQVIDLTQYTPTVYIADQEMMYNFNHGISNIGTVIRTDLLYTDKDAYQEVNANMKSAKISGSTIASVATAISNVFLYGARVQVNGATIFIKYGLSVGTTVDLTNGKLIFEYTKTV